MQPISVRAAPYGGFRLLICLCCAFMLTTGCRRNLPNLVREFDAKHGEVYSVEFLPDDESIMAAGLSGIFVWNRETGKETFHIDTKCRQAKVSPNGKYIVSAGPGNHAYVWDAKTGKEIRRFDGHADLVVCVDISKDSSQAVTGSMVGMRDFKSIAGDYLIRIWDIQSAKQLSQLSGHQGPVVAVCFSPDDRKVISVSMDHTMRLWDAQTGKELRRHPEKVWGKLEATDGSLSQKQDRESLVLSAFTGAKAAAVSFSSDGKLVLRGTGIWDVENWKLVPREPGDLGFGYDFSWHQPKGSVFTPDGRRILWGTGDGYICLSDRETRREVWRTPVFRIKERVPVYAVAISADGKYALSGGLGAWDEMFNSKHDHTVRLWRLPE